jgi:hypothetical protein
LETIIQAGKKGIPVASVPVATNPKLRESRLMRSLFHYLVSSSGTILRIFLMYEPLRVFLTMGFVPFVGGLFLLTRFMGFYIGGQGQGHIQSLIAAAILIVLGLQAFLLGLLADLIARNRQLSEDVSCRLKITLGGGQPEAGQKAHRRRGDRSCSFGRARGKLPACCRRPKPDPSWFLPPTTPAGKAHQASDRKRAHIARRSSQARQALRACTWGADAAHGPRGRRPPAVIVGGSCGIARASGRADAQPCGTGSSTSTDRMRGAPQWYHPWFIPQERRRDLRGLGMEFGRRVRGRRVIPHLPGLPH